MSLFKKSIVLIVLLLVLDQVVKIWIKTHMMLGEEYSVFGDWFLIHFIENNGMAFGMELEGQWGKILLSLFRIFAVCGIGWYLYDISTKKAPLGLVISIALIFSGAMGNIIDSAFYGLIFNDSYYQVSTFMPEGGGYASFLHGKVVDMLYFPLLEGRFPEWLPMWGGEHYIFFRPVFNIADSYITIGVTFILLFQRKYFMKEHK
ncbi:lipoprotein signal peptidase [Labilibaculum sp. A4]|uniref:Lipoprotein signal peptidase n=1 Tax=Labilibaculum euxinus TaxID=2686357 RepID=A0A425Y4K9_9BACT|nr:lipoprotein signal peptidase [Labilibaculum euxinus]MDQ1772437.1 lipoprotein signal peptidase [Labilibaculum euxinus]MUP37423.1 lipoprotein signal peptidase [Labilibaculum euxinus]MVB06628.1 lipoprotein signal peptidase [Labilibaculum euxinus]MWN78141.1 lipoprotein signal peptidase [Labilibaculum euxinus]